MRDLAKWLLPAAVVLAVFVAPGAMESKRHNDRLKAVELTGSSGCEPGDVFTDGALANRSVFRIGNGIEAVYSVDECPDKHVRLVKKT